MSISPFFSGISANNTVEPLYSPPSTTTAATATATGTSSTLASRYGDTLLLKRLNPLSTGSSAKNQSASQTGSASGLAPHHHHGGRPGSSGSSLSSSLLTTLSASPDTSSSAGSTPTAAAQAAAAYQKFSGQSLGSQVNSIISDALSQYSLTASTTSTTL